MIEVVEMLARLVARRQRAIGRIELRRKTAKELGHREIGFPVAVVHGRVEQRRRAGRKKPRVAAPEVAMQQRRPGLMPVQQITDVADVDGITIALRQRELRREATLPPEVCPTSRTRIELRAGANVVVARPAELVAL